MKQHSRTKKNIYTSVLVVLSALMQAFVIQTFVVPSGLLSGGFTGISILIQTVTGLAFDGGIPIYISLLLLNIPVAFLCYKGISPRFTFFSLMQVFLSSFFLSVLRFQPIVDDTMLAVLIGGVLNGLCIVLALRGNASSGGTDFIALYVSNKKGQAIWEYVFVFNVIVLILFATLTTWERALYSILFQFISTKTISAFHHRYEQLTVQVTTEHAETVMDYYFAHHRHGMSCVEGIGGYTHRKVYLLYTVISSYELSEVTAGILEADAHAIINVMRTQRFYGNFYREVE